MKKLSTASTHIDQIVSLFWIDAEIVANMLLCDNFK